MREVFGSDADLRMIAELTDPEMMLLRCMWRSSVGRTLPSLAEEILLKFGISLRDGDVRMAMEQLIGMGFASEGGSCAEADRTSYVPETVYTARISETEFREACLVLQDKIQQGQFW